MNTNFDYLLKEKLYDSFSNQAIEAERALIVSPATCAILSRRALELAVRFVFAYDNALVIPYRDNISSLIHEHSFRGIIEPRLFPMIRYIIKLGNVAVHTNSMIKRDDAILSLRVSVQNPFWLNDQLLCKTENRKFFSTLNLCYFVDKNNDFIQR